MDGFLEGIYFGLSTSVISTRYCLSCCGVYIMNNIYMFSIKHINV